MIYRNRETGEITPHEPFDARNNELWEAFSVKFSAKDYNFVAKRIREQGWQLGDNSPAVLTVRSTLTILALDLAKHYSQDNPRFDPLRFLDACSPDDERYPLSELWEVKVD